MFKLKIKIRTSTIVCIIAILIFLIFLCKYIFNQYIIYKTEQTYNILRKAYTETVKTANFDWERGKVNNDIFAKAFIKNLPIKYDCGYSIENKCFPNTINFQRPLEYFDINSVSIPKYYKVKLKNNVGIAFTLLDPTCGMIRGRCGTIFTDINGSQNGPNKFGEDLYDFSIDKTDITLYPLQASHLTRCVYGTGQGCAAYMFRFRNRNYKSLTPQKAEKLGLNLTRP